MNSIEGGEYRVTLIHADALSDALGAINLLVEEHGYSDYRIAVLRDALDPRPEPDVNGVTPGVFRRSVYNDWLPGYGPLSDWERLGQPAQLVEDEEEFEEFTQTL